MSSKLANQNHTTNNSNPIFYGTYSMDHHGRCYFTNFLSLLITLLALLLIVVVGSTAHGGHGHRLRCSWWSSSLLLMVVIVSAAHGGHQLLGCGGCQLLCSLWSLSPLLIMVMVVSSSTAHGGRWLLCSLWIIMVVSSAAHHGHRLHCSSWLSAPLLPLVLVIGSAAPCGCFRPSAACRLRCSSLLALLINLVVGSTAHRKIDQIYESWPKN